MATTSSPSVKEQKKVEVTESNSNSAPFGGVLKDAPTRIMMECGHAMNGRNLIVCIDGTSNQFGEKNTNVIELYNLILREVEDNQRTWYNSGIGTYAQPSWKSLNYYKKVLDHKIDLAIAWNFERTVLGAYRWLSDNYERGDCIFLFGFSRGAFQVRVLSAMIDKVGLIHKGNEMQIPFAYELYADPKSDLESESVTQVGAPLLGPKSQNKMSKAERFKSAFSHKGVKVHFVGAWDTVSSIGIVRGKQMLPRTVDGMLHVCYFRHALALDERRVKFLPEYAYGGTTKPPGSPEDKSLSTFNHHSANSVDAVAAGSKDTATAKSPHTIEVWFAGTHSDIGGGNVQNAGMDRSRPPLRWMVFEAGSTGLRTARFERELSSKEQIQIKESLTWLWWPFEILPFKRLTFTRQENGKENTHKPHLGSSRKIHPGQKIHSSLLLSNEAHTPKARPPGNEISFWNTLRKEGANEWLEHDLYEYIQNIIDDHIAGKVNISLETLQQVVAWGDGQQALYENVIKGLRKTGLDPTVKNQLLQFAIDVLDYQQLKLMDQSQIHPLVSDLLKSGDQNYQRTAQIFLNQFTDSCILVSHGHTHSVASVAFSPDSKHVVSGSGDGTVQIWNVETGEAEAKPLKGHTGCIMSAAFSPDGKHIVSGAGDGIVQIWNRETGRAEGKPFKEHAGWVMSMAFSPDGKYVVSGSGDGTVQIWNVETGKAEGKPFKGHTGWVQSVAFSSSGRHVVSGSKDCTVRIWNVKTEEAEGRPFTGHTGWVQSVAFSHDGKHVVSGSNDCTVRIWNVKTGQMAGKPFEGHTGWVSSVVFLPYGQYIVSGSHDQTIRIWDVEAGEAEGKPFTGHTDLVLSVAFSPDGKRLVSGSHDKTLRIWDIEILGL